MSPCTSSIVGGLVLAVFAAGGAAQVPVENEVVALLPEGANFGDDVARSVGLSGDWAIVGAPMWTDDAEGSVFYAQGAAWIYHWTGSAWVEEQALLSSGPRPMDHFGTAVDISGDVAVVGVPSTGIGLDQNPGHAFVYRRSGGTWVEEQKLKGLDTQLGDRFGAAVAVDGDFIVVGAPFDDGPGVDTGSVTFFGWNGSSWQLLQKLVGSDSLAGDRFGERVALSGDAALVGVAHHTVGGQTKQGAVYAFRWNGASWVEEQTLTASDGSPFDLFGESVDISGDVAVVGAFQDDVGANQEQGSAYVFRWSGSSWLQEQHLVAAAGADGDKAGNGVAISGDVALVGAPRFQLGDNVDQGTCWVFRHGASGWMEEQQLLASQGQADEWFGWCVAVSGDAALVGAPEDKVASLGLVGSAYAFDLLGDAWTWLGQALPGAQGSPVLSAFGDLTAGSTVSFALGQARASAPVFVVLGLAAATVPFKGGVLVPAPDVVLGGFATDGEGKLALASSWPGGVPAGFSFWAQDWIVDPDGPSGFAASNGVLGTTP